MGSDLIAPGLVPGPKAYMAWTMSSVLTRAQAAHQSQEETGTIPDLQKPRQGRARIRADSERTLAVASTATAPDIEETEIP